MSPNEDRNTTASLIERAIERLVQPSRTGDVRRPSPLAATATPSAAPAGGDVPAAAPPVATETHTTPQRAENPHAPIDLDRLRKAGGFHPTGDFTRTTEEFRIIKRSILLNVATRREQGIANANLIMVTSSREGEGKTFTSINLAMSIAAERDTNVLLIDADLSKPAILERLGLDAETGLIDVLEKPDLDLSSVLIRTNVEGLTVLPAGPHHPFAAELLASARMKQLMAEVSQRYADRIVILDTPPVLATSESATLAMHVGQIALVVEASRTGQNAIKEALGLISICPDIGFILNRVPFQFGTTRFGSYYKNYGKSYSRASKKQPHASQETEESRSHEA